MCTRELSSAFALTTDSTSSRVGQWLARLVLLAAILLAAARPAHATSPVLEATFTTSISNGWVQVERWRDPGTAVVQ